MKTWEFECKDGESVFIRHAKLSDGRNMFEGFAEVVAEKKWLPTLETTTSLAQWFDWIERSKDTDDVILVALIDGHYVGHLTLRPERWDASEHVCRLGIIVRKPYRNIGVGKALMTASEEAAHDTGFEKIILSTLSNNTTANTLYRSMEYREIGIRRNHFKMPDGYINQILFEKLLQ